MKPTYLFIVTIITIGALLGCSKKEEPAPPAQSDTAKSESVSDLTTDSATNSEIDSQTPTQEETKPKAASLDGLTYVKGDAVTIEAGKVYVVEFWATWCPPCRDSIPHLNEIQKKYKDKGVTVLGISTERVDTVKTFVEKMADKMNYTVAVDPNGKVGEGYMGAFNQRGIPTAFVIDGNGKIAWIGHPMGGLDEVLENVVSQQQIPAK